MTLISNIIHNDFIIIASDKRRTIIDRVKKELTSIDDAKKLLSGKNYSIGVQGSLQTKNNNYLKNLNELVVDNNEVNPTEFIVALTTLFPNINEDELCTELNITFSGFYNDTLFSYYLDLKNNIVIDCVEKDKFRLRSNNENDKDADDGILLRTSFIHIKAYLNNIGLYDGFKNPNLQEYDFKTLIQALEFMYQKFHENDLRYNTIGGQMEYCVFSNNAIIQTNL
jgi:hypothetical protein